MTAPRPETRGRRLRTAMASIVGMIVVRLLGLTWRMRMEGPDLRRAAHARGEAVAIALWHGELLPLLWYHRKQGIAALISSHADGEVIARIVQSLGFQPIRGSTSRGGVRALAGAVTELRGGRDVAFTTDGPRGPRRVSAPGVGVAAAKAGVCVLPVGMQVTRAWVFRSWDRFVLPKPFATITVRYADPIRAAGSAAADGERIMPEVDQALMRVAMPDAD
jgi:lysophospholipid acyltransferase (LPLAT)-like uncharacterized protein